MTVKITYTNATALARAIELARDVEDTALANKLARIYESTTKPRRKSNEPTKEQLKTLAMMNEAIAKMETSGEDTFTTAWVMANVQYVTSPQKASAVLKKAIENGKVVRGELVKGRMTYHLAD